MAEALAATTSSGAPLALTTTFTPAPSCFASTNLWQVFESDGSDQYEMVGPPEGGDCMPSGFESATKASTYAAYSPGICPDGFTTAKEDRNQYLITFGTFTETTKVCCPTAYDFTTQPTERPSDLKPFMSSILCQSQWADTPSVPSITVTKSTVGDSSTEVAKIPCPSGGGFLRANGIIVKFQSGDFDSKKTTGTSSGTSAGQSPTSSGTGGGDGGGGGGLSTGASVGIGVGVGVIGLAAIIGLVWFLLRSRNRKQQKLGGLEPYTQQDTYPEWRPPPQQLPMELPASTKYAHNPVAPSAPPQELEARTAGH